MEDVKNTSIDGKERDRWLIVGSILTAAGGAILAFFGVGRN